MASAVIREELKCSICQEIYKDPVTLPCGHSFCQECINQTWDSQQVGEYFCPECCHRSVNRPQVKLNLRLRNIAQSLLGEEKKAEITCTYCVDSPAAAVKSCLHCEASLCDKHLKVHNKSPKHVLCDPTADLGTRICSIHNKILKYYCREDSTCICESCMQKKKQQGQTTETLKEASKKKKQKCQQILKKMTATREVTETKIQNLQKRKGRVQEKSFEITDKIALLFRPLRRRLEDLESKVLSEISNRKEQVSGSLSNQIRQLEIKKDELSRKMNPIEELCNKTDPLTVLWESNREDLFCGDKEEGPEDEEADDDTQDTDDSNEILISLNIRKELADILNNVMKNLLDLEESDIYFDKDTAAPNVEVSGDQKVAYGIDIENDETIEQTSQTFDSYQVLSSTALQTGRHYWEVDISGSNNFRIGMCYASIDRKGLFSIIGNSPNSWCLVNSRAGYSVKHSNIEQDLSHKSLIKRLGIYLDYEAGRLAFYSMGDVIRHLHTFTATFTEPLHAVFRVGSDVWVRIRS